MKSEDLDLGTVHLALPPSPSCNVGVKHEEILEEMKAESLLREMKQEPLEDGENLMFQQVEDDAERILSFLMFTIRLDHSYAAIKSEVKEEFSTELDLGASCSDFALKVENEAARFLSPSMSTIRLDRTNGASTMVSEVREETSTDFQPSSLCSDSLQKVPIRVDGESLTSANKSPTDPSMPSGSKLFDCGTCGGAFLSIRQLARHLLVKHGDPGFHYRVFPTQLNNEGHLKEHSSVVTGEKPFECSVCRKTFSLEVDLKSHLILHTFECGVCKKTFSRKLDLESHLMVHAGECTVCGKKFNNRKSLKSHLLVHTGEKPFECIVCGKGFSLKSGLKLHSTVHADEKQFLCTICGKKLSRQDSLKSHLLVHTGEKPFECTVCGKGFSLKSGLKLHSTVHADEKQFLCTICGKRFSRKCRLKSHLLVHTGGKPFECSVCGKRYSWKSSLKLHSTVHAGEKRVKLL